MTGTCSRCGRPVIEARTLPGMQRVLLDPGPAPDGVYMVDLDVLPMPTAQRRWRPDVTPMSGGWPIALYPCHFDTCPAKATTAAREKAEA